MRATLAIFILVCLLAPIGHTENAILVLDESGSMWGQIDGKTKIEIARSVIADLLTKVPAERGLGLVAYGHRRQGDCSDIEEIVPVGTDRAAILTRVNALKPKGKTPLTDGVRFAAQKLRYTEEKATVILVSDGAESCNADPCALGRELEAAGADFTTHVIGFGLASATESAGLRCLAEATGGRYFAASNAQELSSALVATVAAPEPVAVAATTGHLILRATELAGGPEVKSGLEWRVAAAGADPMYTGKDTGVVETDIAPGNYIAEVRRTADGLAGSASADVTAGSERTVTIALDIVVQASLVLTPEGTAPASSKVSVAWQGPDRDGDYITVTPTDAEVSAYGNYVYTHDGNPVEIQVPASPGAYQMRYVLGAPQRVLAAVPISVTPVSATLEAPAQVGAGAPIPISWTGPNAHGDWITIVVPTAPVPTYGSYVDTERGGPASLDAPAVPGAYELRYVAQGTEIIARVPIEVTAVTATIEAVASVPAGSQFPIKWTGPNNHSDWLTIIAPDAAVRAYGSYVDADRGSPAILDAPVAPGRYELRYVAQGTKIIARAPIEVTAVTATIEAVESVHAGSQFQIAWSGPNNHGDWLTVITPDAGASVYGSYVDADGGSPATLTAPAAAGAYELRYVQNGTTILARRTIQVTAD